MPPEHEQLLRIMIFQRDLGQQNHELELCESQGEPIWADLIVFDVRILY